jgi:hypothetical protein
MDKRETAFVDGAAEDVCDLVDRYCLPQGCSAGIGRVVLDCRVD